MKIYIVFSKSDFEYVSSKIRTEDWVIGEVNDLATDNFIDVRHVDVPHDELNRSYSDAICHDVLKSKIFAHYTNNFYECSILPLVRYYLALEVLIEKVEGKIDSVVFASGQLKLRSLTYYMAEHETQGYSWYARSAMFTPYLASYLKEKQINFEIGKHSGQFKIRLHRFLRQYAVFFVKFLKSSVDILKTKNVDTKLGSEEQTEAIVVTRSQSQSALFLPYLSQSKIKTEYLAGESSIDFGRNVSWLKSRSAVGAIKPIFKRSDIFILLKSYIYCYYLLLTAKIRAELRFRDLSFDLTDALREVIVMYPELNWYKHSLNGQIKTYKVSSKVKVLFTSEQKSPHASIDAELARNNGLKCLQFMSCDQEYSFIPRPVVGDAFLVDTQFSKEKFLEVFPDSAFEYIGSLKGITEKRDNVDKNLVCYFTNPRLIQLNKKNISVLLNACKNSKYEVVVKLHPRDSLSNYSEFKNLRLIRHGDLDSAELYKQLHFAVSNNSGVIMDLLYQKVPYVLLRFLAQDRFEVPYIDTEYRNVCYDERQLCERLEDMDSIPAEFFAFRERFMERNNIIVSVEEIDNKLNQLIYKL